MTADGTIAECETVARFIRDPGSFSSARKKAQSKGESLDLSISEIVPFRLFRPRTGESVTSLIRERYGEEDVRTHGAVVNAVALAEFRVADALSIEDASGEKAFRVNADPLYDFQSHAVLTTPHIEADRFPHEKGEPMGDGLRAELKSLYNQLYAICKPKPPLSMKEWALVRV